MRYEPIYTEKTECRDCYKCVRACPVKAIQVHQGSAVVVHDRCIFCGKCVDACPVHAKKIRNDVPRARRLIKDRSRVYVSLAPSFVTEFAGCEQQLLMGLRALGFAGVSETALGAEIVSAHVDTFLAQSCSTPLISSACPTVVQAIEKYYPSLIDCITPVRSPLGAHALMLREHYGASIGVVFIGPCISKKLEADRNPGLPDVALTFKELRGWMQECGVDLQDPQTLCAPDAAPADPMSAWFGCTLESPKTADASDPISFIPRKARTTTNYALESGMISSLSGGDVELQDRTAGISGILDVLQSLEGIAADLSGCEAMPVFFELLSCRGGCINGPGCTEALAPVLKKAVNSRYTRARLKELSQEPREAVSGSIPPIACDYHLKDQMGSGRLPAAEFEIERMLKRLGKADPRERLDCGGCGYNSCRDFAIACINGMAEAEMCVTNMRKQAQSKVDMLLRTLPMGVVIVDHGYRIVDCNAQFLRMFSSITYDADDRELNRVSGLSLNKFLDISSHLSEVFCEDQPVIQRTIRHTDRILAITFFSIDQKRLAGALFQDITKASRNRDAVMKRAEAVIQKNLQSVQQIASLLGENAAETEIMLSSMIDVFEQNSEECRGGSI
jgi:iron only hydrogenase large subunit-like protein